MPFVSTLPAAGWIVAESVLGSGGVFSRYTAGFARAMWICSGLCVVGGAVALLTVREGWNTRFS